MKKKTVVVKVTAANIKQGIRHRFCFCPIAIAMLEAGFDKVVIDSSSITFEMPNSMETLYTSTPDVLADFIARFDKYGAKKVKPFQFKVIISKAQFGHLAEIIA